MNVDTKKLLHIFSEESSDLLHLSEQALLRLEDNTDDSEAIDELFRAFHTVKGSAGLFGLDAIVDFTHVVESLLDQVRDGDMALSEDMISVFLSARDHVESLVAFCTETEGPLPTELQTSNDKLLSDLNAFMQADFAAAAVAPESDDSSLGAEPDDGDGVENEYWHISLRFGPDALRNGMDPISFINYLGNMGELVHVLVVEDALPNWNDLDPEICYLGCEIDLDADADRATIEGVFEFVQDDCQVRILQPHAGLNQYAKLVASCKESSERMGELLVGPGTLSAQEFAALDGHATKNTTAQTVAQTSQSASPPPAQPAYGRRKDDLPETSTKATAKIPLSVRVNSDKLGALIDLVGELVIGSAAADLLARKIEDVALIESLENLSRLVEEIRDTTLGLRMVQIGETFTRFKRVVREVSREMGKDINLVIAGAETELDKTVVEKIGDPLMHLVRNALDHGIEPAEERLAAGKPATGTVTLDAYHDSGSIVIQISDDGGGLPRDKIHAKAVEKELITPNQVLTDQEVYKLIFEPGFSTADAVTNISGRGVGMDVVRRNIEALRGYIEVDSKPGEGSRFSIRLPLTLAIIDGFQVRVGESHYIIPLDMVDECIELTTALRGEESGGKYINLRGSVLPYVRLGDVFGDASDQGKDHRDNIVVAKFAGLRAGFVVDELLGEHQTVIKPMGKVFQNLKSISGATILGTGEVALIVDVPSLVNIVTKQGKKVLPFATAEGAEQGLLH